MALGASRHTPCGTDLDEWPQNARETRALPGEESQTVQSDTVRGGACPGLLSGRRSAAHFQSFLTRNRIYEATGTMALYIDTESQRLFELRALKARSISAQGEALGFGARYKNKG